MVADIETLRDLQRPLGILPRSAGRQRSPVAGSPLVAASAHGGAVRHFGGIIGSSDALKETLAQLSAVAVTPATALVVGESGVGKELMARAIHRLSSRNRNRLVKVNCASIPEELFESEFFGHIKGSFTSAHRDRTGRFELADGGTLFLDEVGEIPLGVQAKLLRVLQEGQFERVGDEKTRTSDVRIIAATNKDLQQAILDGVFRSDLYYRLSVFPIRVPPLRERIDDVEALARHFLKVTSKQFGCPVPLLSDRHVSMLQAHDWPGNVRELRNVIERSVIMSMNGRFELELVSPVGMQAPEKVSFPRPAGPGGVVREQDWNRAYRENVIAALEASNWRVSGNSGAAHLLGINASTLRSRMKSLRIPMARDAQSIPTH